MIAHLDDIGLTAWLVSEDDAAALEHLEACAPCRKEAVELRQRLQAFREAIHAAGEAREIKWVPPAEAAAERRASAGVIVTWAARATLSACVLALALLVSAPKPAVPPASNDAADNALLEKIQADLNRQAPQALAPAESLLAQMTVTDSSNRDAEQQGGNQ